MLPTIQEKGYTNAGWVPILLPTILGWIVVGIIRFEWTMGLVLSVSMLRYRAFHV